MKTLTWQKPGQQNVAQELIKIIINYVAELRVITNSIVEINIDSLLKYEDSYSFKKIYFSGYTNVPSFCKYDETRYLAQNKYYSIVKDLDNDVDRFLFVKKNEFDITNKSLGNTNITCQI